MGCTLSVPVQIVYPEDGGEAEEAKLSLVVGGKKVAPPPSSPFSPH